VPSLYRKISSREPARGSPRWWLILLVVWAVSGFYTASLLKRGWVPHDEGTIGQSAERVLEGQLPHRDFEEVYTGGLTYLNAFAFRLFGENLASPRIMLFLFFLTWVPAVYWIASRFTSDFGAAAVTPLAVAWGVPNYTAALPSWYNLFFATFGVVALLRYLDTNSRKWLFVAGLCCGVSFLFKLSGIYFAAGLLLFLVFRQQEFCRDDPRGQRPRPSLYSALVASGLIAFIAAIFVVVRHDLSVVAVVEFVWPGLSLAVLCVGREIGGIPGSFGRRLSLLLEALWPFAVGAALPALLFLIIYARAGAISDLIYGVFVLPERRLAFASHRPIGFSLNKILGAIALVGLLTAAYFSCLKSKLAQVLIAAALLGVLVFSKNYPKFYTAAWAPLVLLISFSAILGAFVLGNSQTDRLRRQQVMLLLSVTTTCTLIQLPFSVPIYFCYVAPLLVLSMVALFSIPARTSKVVLSLLLAFYVAFAVLRFTPGFLYTMGFFYQPDPETEVLRLPRAGGLRIDPSGAHDYEYLIREIQQHAGTSPYIYAAPDCPEVYFLSGKQNPTPTMFDFFDDSEGHTERVLETIKSHDIQLVTIMRRPQFSPPMSGDLVTALRDRFPQGEQIGPFEVRWRP
jgi:hypothetical protein